MKMKPSTAIALSIALHVAAVVLVGMMLRPIFRAFAFSRSIVFADLVGADKIAKAPTPAVPPAAPPKPAPWEIAPPGAEENPSPVPQAAAPAAPPAQPARSSPPSPPPSADNATPGAPLPAASVTGILQGRRLSDAFGGMSRQQQVAASVTRFQRNAPPTIAQMIREARPPVERGKTKVVLPAGTDGKPLGPVEIGGGSPALEKALGRVAWDKAPLPWREGIPSGVMTLEIAVEGDRVDVKIDFR
jgi:hypothetical protein